MLCPFCRREIVIPDEGFPICRLSDFLRDQVNIAQNKPEARQTSGIKGKNYIAVLIMDTTPISYKENILITLYCQLYFAHFFHFMGSGIARL